MNASLAIPPQLSVTSSSSLSPTLLPSLLLLLLLLRLATAKMAAACSLQLGSLSLGMLIRKLLKIIKNFRGLSDGIPPFAPSPT